ncbi:MAG: cation diffusion facilitator family transporter [Lachnospiraceae bacterium]
MISLLIRHFITNSEDTRNPDVRQKYGMICGFTGIILNLFLFLGKLMIGIISGSIAIMADALNNLSDAGSSIVTLVGFQMAGSKPDPDHPFGHGRIEYLSGLTVAGIILIMAYQLIRDSISSIVSPSELTFEPLTIAVLLISICIKIYMAFYNSRIGKKINSAAMRATAKDSLNDVAATAVVLISVLVYQVSGIVIDGYCGLLVAIFILFTGISAAKDTIDPLLGQAPKEEFIDEITGIVMSYPKIMGIHDMVVHDYGPGRQMVSLHVEVPAEEKILEIHDIIDNIEAALQKELSIHAVIHMDPVVTKDERVLEIKRTISQIIAETGKDLSMHDFRVVLGESHTNIIFDLVVPYKYHLQDDQIKHMIDTKLAEVYGAGYNTVIQFDKDFIGTSGISP